MRAKDCPGCGAVLPISTKECSHCDYQFTSKSMLVSQQSAIEESNTIREKFPFEPERVRTSILGMFLFCFYIALVERQYVCQLLRLYYIWIV